MAASTPSCWTRRCTRSTAIAALAPRSFGARPPSRQKHGLQWLHVDFPPELADFYQKAGFHFTTAGLLRLHGVG
jgi:hypothetical protein